MKSDVDFSHTNNRSFNFRPENFFVDGFIRRLSLQVQTVKHTTRTKLFKKWT